MEKKIKPPSDNHLLALGTDNRVEKLATLRHFVFIMYKLYDIVYSLYLRQDDDYISSVLAPLDQRLASLDENNVVENETFDKKNAFTKKPLLAQSPESREDMIKAEEWLQALVSLRHSKILSQNLRENSENIDIDIIILG